MNNQYMYFLKRLMCSAEAAGGAANKLQKSEEDIAERRRENDIVKFRADRDACADALHEPTLTELGRSFFLARESLANWKLAKLEHPNDLVQIEASRKALVDAEVRYEREEERDYWTKRIVELRLNLNQADDFFKEVCRKDLTVALSKAIELTISGPRESELKNRIEAKYTLTRANSRFRSVSNPNFAIKNSLQLT